MTTNQTPREIDTQLAALYNQRALASRILDNAYDAIHRAAGDRKNWNHRHPMWQLTSDQAIDKATGTYAGDRAIKARDTARENIARIDAAIWPLEAIYQDRRWNRYFLVTNSNGHVHRGTTCSTCFPTTEYAWLVELADC